MKHARQETGSFTRASCCSLCFRPGGMKLPDRAADQVGFERALGRFLSRGGSVDARYDHETRGTTLLIQAARKGYAGAVEQLLSKQANVDLASGSDQCTALMHAVRSGHSTTVQRLLRAGASCTQVDSLGRTALQQCRGPDAMNLGASVYFMCVPATEEVNLCIDIIRSHLNLSPLEDHEREHVVVSDAANVVIGGDGGSVDGGGGAPPPSPPPPPPPPPSPPPPPPASSEDTEAADQKVREAVIRKLQEAKNQLTTRRAVLAAWEVENHAVTREGNPLKMAVRAAEAAVTGATTEAVAVGVEADFPVFRLLDLNDDSLGRVMALASLVDDLLAISLTCRRLQEIRWQAAPRMQTLARSTLRSESLRTWASSVGCPPPYPSWCEIVGLTSVAGSGLNGRVCKVLGPPNAAGRCETEVDSGHGSLDTYRHAPASGTAPLSGLRRPRPPSLEKAVGKLVRPANLRVLPDTEMLMATRILCVGEDVRSGEIASKHALRPVRIPRRHSAVVFMQAAERARLLEPLTSQTAHSPVDFHRPEEGTAPVQAEDEDAALDAQLRNALDAALDASLGIVPFGATQRACLDDYLRRALSELGWCHPPLGFDDDDLSTSVGSHEAWMSLQRGSAACFYRCPLAAYLHLPELFIQQVDTEPPRLGTETRDAHLWDNPCVSQLMSWPELEWRGAGTPRQWCQWVGSVVAFRCDAHVTPSDVYALWRFALKMDPGDYQSTDEYLAGHTIKAFEQFNATLVDRGDLA